jgi:nitrite reductase/ring-hydroxylating ferredoxin subunit
VSATSTTPSTATSRWARCERRRRAKAAGAIVVVGAGGDVSDGRRVELGDLSDLADGQQRRFGDLGRVGIVVCRAGGVLYALDDRCSHADTPLSEGRVRGLAIICPLHGASFDLRNGAHLGPPAWEGVACHRVEERDDGASVVLVDRPAERFDPGAPPRMR